jgi:hypothetical protein
MGRAGAEDWVLVVAPAIYAGVIGRGDAMACSKPAIKSNSPSIVYCTQEPSEAVDSTPASRPVPEGHSANQSLSASEPVSAPPKRKLENRQQRPAPETRPARTEIPAIAGQRLVHPSLTRGNDGDSPPPGNNTPETGLRG